MRDEDFVARLNELDGQGPAGIMEMRDVLRSEGGMSRLIGIAMRAARTSARSQAAARKTKLPSDFPGPEEKEAARKYWESHRRPDLVATMQDEIEKFTAHHIKNGTVTLSWPMSWKTWYCNAINFNAPPRGADLFVVPGTFEDASVDGWVMRLEIFHGFTAEPKGTWLDKWAARPDTPGHKVKKEAWPIFWRMHPEMKPAVTG